MSQCAAIIGPALEVVVVYGDDSWRGVLERVHLTGIRLQHLRRGETLARPFMAAFLPPSCVQIRRAT
jgi:hypothetical protein